MILFLRKAISAPRTSGSSEEGRFAIRETLRVCILW